MGRHNGSLSTIPVTMSMLKCENKTYKLGKELFYYVPLIYGIPTVFLYINIAIVIIMKSKNPFLKLAFLRIYAVYSSIMVVMWCFDMSTTRFLGIGYFCKELLTSWGTPTYEISIVQFIMTYSRHAQFYAATMLSINRMTAVLIPIAYNEIWEHHWKKFLAIILILPFLSSWYLLPTEAYIAPYILGGLTIAYIKILPEPVSSVTFTTLFVALTCALTIFIASAITYFKLSCKRRRFRCTKVDRVLLVVGLTSSITTFTLALVEVPLYITINFGTMSRDHFFIATCIKQCVIDFTFVCSAWSTVIQCSTIRSSILKLYFPKWVKAQGLMPKTPTATKLLLSKNNSTNTSFREGRSSTQTSKSRILLK